MLKYSAFANFPVVSKMGTDKCNYGAGESGTFLMGLLVVEGASRAHQLLLTPSPCSPS